MRRHRSFKALAMVLAVIMLLGMVPADVIAAGAPFDPSVGDDYYKVIAKRDWELAPGIQESEVILNNSEGTLRQVTHVVEVDMNNPYTKVVPGYKGMIPKAGSYGVQSVSEQARYAEENGYGNVVAATNCSLSWYNDAYYQQQHPELIGEPLGYTILDGEMFVNSRGRTYGCRSCLVINYNEKDGVPRPDDIPRVTVRSTSEELTGWEEQVIPVNFALLVKDGKNLYENEKNHTSGFESRTFVGAKEDGTLVVAVVDGRQAPYSSGFNNYEMADYMIKLGCVVAANADGGGSTEFMSQRPGEDLKINCSLSDGGERPTTNTILVMSTAPANGEFARATVKSDYDYYAPGSTVSFSALGSDAVGTSVDVPADAAWTIKEDGMGTIDSNGVFTSNGTEGPVTAQLVYNGAVVGERTVEIITPTGLSFTQPVVTIPYGKTARIPVKATIENGLKEVSIDGSAVSFETDNPALGNFEGLNFAAVSEAEAPENISSTVTATLTLNPSITAQVELKLGRESVVLEDFENGLDDWVCIVQRNPGEAHRDFVHDISLASGADGQVHNGEHSMRLQTNGIHSSAVHSQQYAYVRFGMPFKEVTLENARALGFWLYVPEDNIQCWVMGFYRYDTNGDGVPDTTAEVNMMTSETCYYNFDESGWHYLSMDLSGMEKVTLGEKHQIYGASGQTGDFTFAIIFHKAINNQLWQTNGTINGPFTYYIDNVTVDYSEAVEDREEPVFEKIYLNGSEAKKRAVVTTDSDTIEAVANVHECFEHVATTGEKTPLNNYTGINAASAKAYVDGVEVPCTFANDQITVSGVKVADGFHRVKFEVCDNAGNKAVKIRVMKVESGSEASTIHFVPADATLDRLPGGSVYWMNLVATDIETIQSVEAVIDMNSVNHWELDHMVLADGFTADYSISEETNTATIRFDRTGKNVQTGEAVLAQIPVRIISFDGDMQIPGYTAETFWKNYHLWPQDLKLDIDKGVITYVDGYKGTAMNTFSNEEFHVDSEIYTDAQCMDVNYRAEKGTAHVHTPAAIADQAPTCTQPGYTGRTFCEVCNSVVDWGTAVEPTGHHYVVDGSHLVCSDCGDAFDGSGLVQVNGHYYYCAYGGELLSGWIQVDKDLYDDDEFYKGWYYFDPDTYTTVESLNNGYVTYTFKETGEVEHGQWHKTSKGIRYYYGPTYIMQGNTLDKWVEIDGNRYCFRRLTGYVYTGTTFILDPKIDPNNPVYYWHVFDENGVWQSSWDYTGFADLGGYTYYVVNGITELGMHEVDGEYYYSGVANHYAIIKNQNYNCYHHMNGTGFAYGYYWFGADGKMLNNDVYCDGDTLYYFVKGQKSRGTGSVELNGERWAIDANGKVDFTGTVSDASGKTQYYEHGVYVHVPLNGPDGDYFYVNDVIQQRYQLVEYEGDYYFINDGNKLAKNTKLYLGEQFVAGHNYPDGQPMVPGYYEFDADGKMILLNGIVGDYYYVNGVVQKAWKLIEVDGSYYFINDYNKLAKNTRLYLSQQFVEGHNYPNGDPMVPGYYDFDADGKIILLNGIVGDYYYVNGIIQKAWKLIEVDGGYYFINDYNKLAKNKTLYLGEQFVAGHSYPNGDPMVPGYYQFDADGKMVIQNGIIGDYYYVNGIVQKAWKLIEVDGSYYFINDYNKLAKSTRLYLGEQFVAGHNYPNGDPMVPGYYEFDAEGKMILLNGIVGDYYYVNGVVQKAWKLIEVDGSYYFINDYNKLAKSKKLYLSEQFVQGHNYPNGDPMVPGYYDFDAEGKMVLLNGIVGDYYYVNGVVQKAWKLIEVDGDFYFINDNNKLAKDKTLYLSAQYVEGHTYLNGDPLTPGYYHFGPDGKMTVG